MRQWAIRQIHRYCIQGEKCKALHFPAWSQLRWVDSLADAGLIPPKSFHFTRTRLSTWRRFDKWPREARRPCTAASDSFCFARSPRDVGEAALVAARPAIVCRCDGRNKALDSGPFRITFATWHRNGCLVGDKYGISVKYRAWRAE